jgi:protein associated with RNAse G/E
MVQVVSTKYDGTPRETYEAGRLESNGELVQLVVHRGTLVWGDKLQRWVDMDTDAVDTYLSDRWYNVYHYGSSAPHPWYCNIAMPATFDGAKLRWVDLEIDVSCHPDGSIVVLNEDEFEVNRVEMAYPEHVAERALTALDEVPGLARKGLFPFDHAEQLRRLG